MADIDSKVKELYALTEAHNFAGAFELVRGNLPKFSELLEPAGVQKALKDATKDRRYLSFLDNVQFGEVKLEESFAKLEKLLSFEEGALVLSKAWGLGKVKRVDDFYQRIVVDFPVKKGHQFSYAAACDLIVRAPDDHILVLKEADRDAFNALLANKRGEFVKKVLKSYGEPSLNRLEEICIANGFVKKEAWKKFWSDARIELLKDKFVKIPAKRTEPIRVLSELEKYGANWFAEFTGTTDPLQILMKVRELLSGKGDNKQEQALAELDEKHLQEVKERLAFAVTAAKRTNDALYARLAVQVTKMKFETPKAEDMRAYLKERSRFVKAAANMPAGEVGSLIRFLADSDETKALIYKHLPDLCYAAVQETIRELGNDPNCRAAIGAQLKLPNAPATLTAFVIGKYDDYKGWQELPPLSTLLMHAIALGESRQSGENLRMQNIVRRLFADKKWLQGIFGHLSGDEQRLIFERLQASLTWESASHNLILKHMIDLNPELAKLVVKEEKKKEYPRVTSYRSFGLKKREYLKLINEDMPENVRKIEFAKGFGDLSENAEYQYAKDEQRTLMQKQSLMQADLEAVKPSDFSDATCDEVMPGVMVTVQTEEGGKTYAILGEWDNDVEMGILSQRAKLAENMLGKKAGDKFELPGAEGEVKFGVIKLISPLTEAVKNWMKLPEGVQI